MKISKIFHWLYLTVMLLPLLAVFYNFIRFGLSSSITLLSFDDVIGLVSFPVFGGLSSTITDVFTYLVSTLFGFSGDVANVLIGLMTYWLSVSLIWLCFDVLIYVPQLVHRWLDKGVID